MLWWYEGGGVAVVLRWLNENRGERVVVAKIIEALVVVFGGVFPVKQWNGGGGELMETIMGIFIGIVGG